MSIIKKRTRIKIIYLIKSKNLKRIYYNNKNQNNSMYNQNKNKNKNKKKNKNKNKNKNKIIRRNLQTIKN